MKTMMFWEQATFALHALSVATVLVALGLLLSQNSGSTVWLVLCWTAAIPPILFAVGVGLDFPEALESVFLVAMKVSLVVSSPIAAIAAISAARAGRKKT